MTTYAVSISLDDIKEVALRGIRRAALFMGLGVNAATNPGQSKYSLSTFTYLDVIGRPLNDAEIPDTKTHFKKWVEGNGLRELNESFAVYLDGVHWLVQ